jgi:ABC-2 type transport system permease protein
MNRYVTLIKRELWEHTSLFRLPAIFYLIVVLGNLIVGNLFQYVEYAPNNIQQGMFRGAFGTVNSVAFIAFVFLAAFYLLDCLYTERKDRSILFWRSLPVSDTETVLIKLFTAVVVIPAILWLTLISAHITTLILQSVLDTSEANNFLGVISLGSYWLNLAAVLLITMLWSLPLLSWLMFCSSWSSRTPLLTVIAIPIVVALVDVLLPFDLNLGSHMLSRLPFGFGNQGGASTRYWVINALTIAHSSVLSSSIVAVLSRLDLWLGLLVSAVLITLTIQVRRWRDAS